MILTRQIEIDETMAELFLSYEKPPEPGVFGTNRKASEIVVTSYAEAMDRNEWRTTHQGIAFTGLLADETAVLVDGGQRMRAVVLANKWRRAKGESPVVVRMMVSENLTQEDVLAMDLTKRRLPGDFLTMIGEKDTNLLASIVRVCYLYKNIPYTAEAWRSFRVSPTLQKTFIEQNPRIREAPGQGKHLAKLMNATAAGSGWFLALDAGVDEGLIKEFVSGLYYGANLTEHDPILTLRNLMLNSEKYHRVWTTPEQLALYIKAMRKWLDGVPSKQLTFRYDERFPSFND